MNVSFFETFGLLQSKGVGVEAEVKGKKWPKMTKKSLSHSVSQELYVI